MPKNYDGFFLIFWRDFLQHIGVTPTVGCSYLDELRVTEEVIAEKGDY